MAYLEKKKKNKNKQPKTKPQNYQDSVRVLGYKLM